MATVQIWGSDCTLIDVKHLDERKPFTDFDGTRFGALVATGSHSKRPFPANKYNREKVVRLGNAPLECPDPALRLNKTIGMIKSSNNGGMVSHIRLLNGQSLATFVLFK